MNFLSSYFSFSPDCDSSPCQNEGFCHDVREVNGYVCQCLPGWVGPNCEIPVGMWLCLSHILNHNSTMKHYAQKLIFTDIFTWDTTKIGSTL